MQPFEFYTDIVEIGVKDAIYLYNFFEYVKLFTKINFPSENLKKPVKCSL